MSVSAPRPRRLRTRLALTATAAVAAAALALTVCATTSAPADDRAADAGHRRIGVILGGGGEVGIAWQTGVLAALATESGLTPDTVDTVVGTSAGAYAGAFFSLGLDLDRLVEQERSGRAASAPVAGGDGENPIPPKLMAALSSTEGTIEERDRRIGALAMKAPVGISAEDYVAYVGGMLPTSEWPALDFRATSVDTRTGKTVLWDSRDGVPLADALASSSAVPGFLPAVEIDGEHYTDAPRTSFSKKLVAEKDLDTIVYIGMPTANLSNTVEEDALADLRARGVRVVSITGSDKANEVAADALDPKARPAAVRLGLDDGRAAAAAVSRAIH